MGNYIFRSLNTGRESKTRIGACMAEFADYFHSDSFDIPGPFYPILILGAPFVVSDLYLYSLIRNEPIERISKVQL